MKYTELNYDGYDKYIIRKLPMLGGITYEFAFPNRYGASVIKHRGSFDASDDLFELAVLKDRDICYSTYITDDVIGYLRNDEVLELLERIKELTGE